MPNLNGAVNLNPEIVSSVIKNIILQVGHTYDKAKELPSVISALEGIRSANSWGDLASKTVKAAKPLVDAGKNDVIPWVKTINKIYSTEDNIIRKMPAEFVPAASGAASGFAAKAGAMLGSTLGGAGLLAAGAGGAALLGAGAIGYGNYKHNKMINEWNNQTINDRSIFDYIKNKSNKNKWANEAIATKLPTSDANNTEPKYPNVNNLYKNIK